MLGLTQNSQLQKKDIEQLKLEDLNQLMLATELVQML